MRGCISVSGGCLSPALCVFQEHCFLELRNLHDLNAELPKLFFRSIFVPVFDPRARFRSVLYYHGSRTSTYTLRTLSGAYMYLYILCSSQPLQYGLNSVLYLYKYLSWWFELKTNCTLLGLRETRSPAEGGCLKCTKFQVMGSCSSIWKRLA